MNSQKKRDSDDPAVFIQDVLKQYGIVDPRLVNDLRKIVLHVAAEQKGNVTYEMISKEIQLMFPSK